MSYLEGIGVLMENRLIDPKLLDNQFSSVIIMYWEKYGPLLTELESRTDSPELAEWTELFYKRVKPIREEQRRRRVAMAKVGSGGVQPSGEVVSGGKWDEAFKKKSP
jgi:hypothetical protein